MIKYFLFAQKVKQVYQYEKKARIGVSDLIEMLSACEGIHLDIPEDGTEVAGGWRVILLIYPQVRTLLSKVSFNIKSIFPHLDYT